MGQVYPWTLTLSFKDAGMLCQMKVTVSQAATVSSRSDPSTEAHRRAIDARDAADRAVVGWLCCCCFARGQIEDLEALAKQRFNIDKDDTVRRGPR